MEQDKKLKNFIKTTLREFLNENMNEEFTANENNILTESEGNYDLSNPKNLDNFFMELIQLWTKYCGQNPNNSGIANDNRVILYNLLKSGELAEKINQFWSPSSLHLAGSSREYFTANPEAMSNHLKSIGITDFKLKIVGQR